MAQLFPAIKSLRANVERMLGEKEGVEVGIALELYRRRNGSCPTSLEALTPTFLPRVPIDRVGGGPVRYRVIAGRPVVYSVGGDHDDDGGRAAEYRGEPAPAITAYWGTRGKEIDGDWILYGGRAD